VRLWLDIADAGKISIAARLGKQLGKGDGASTSEARSMALDDNP
jgi:hypothetical protein